MFDFLTHPKLTTKVILLGAGSVLITSVALVALAAWQNAHYQSLAQKEVDALVGADLDHIAQGVYSLVQTENDAVQQQVSYNLNVARHILANAGPVSLASTTVTWTAVNQLSQEHTEIQLPAMLVGDAWLGQNTDPAVESAVVDVVTRMVGETATVFQRMNERGDMLRVATTVKDTAGRRAIGTYIPAINPDGKPNPVVSAILNGEAYHGRAFVVNTWYLTAYQPIQDAAGKLAGMLYVGARQKNVEARVRQAILQTRVGKTGYIYVLGGRGEERGHYIISQRGERDGEDVWESKDSEGRLVIQNVIGKALALKPGEITTERYRWQNPDDPVPRWKVARLMYYAPWDWVIGTSVYEDELQHYRTVLNAGRLQMTGFMSAAGLLIALLVGLAGVLLAWTLTRPIRQITQAAETITRGNLNQTVEVRSHDEIGTLANTFNFMTSQLRQTLAGLRQENLDRAKAEQAVRERETKLQSLLRSAPIGLGVTEDRRVTDVNDFLCQMMGASREELIGQSVRAFYATDEEYERMGEALSLPGGVFSGDFKMRRKDGSLFDAQINMAHLNSDEPTQGVAFALVDLTQRRRTEGQLRQQAALLQASHDAILVWDLQHGVQFMNPAAEALSGVTFAQAEAQPLSVALRPRSDLELQAAIQEVTTRGDWTGELTVLAGDGSTRDVASRWTVLADAQGQPTSVLITCNDITEQKRLETQYLRAQRLESVGTLASGVAHDLNNILSPVLMGVGLLELEASNEDTRSILNMMKDSARRGVDTVKQLLTFARGADAQKGPVQPRHLLKEIARLLQQTFPKNIQIYTDYAGQPATVLADPSQLHQVLMNLCVNARDAMPDGGVLFVKLENQALDEAGADIHPKARPIPYVVFKVSDSGAGIPPEIVDRIFDPFFTTKPQGKGTGLGLATVIGIVENHGGFVLVDSKPGQGTTFQVFLPAGAPAEGGSATPESSVVPRGQGELVLVVDDEPAILHLAAEILRHGGYSTLTASNASEALHHFEKHHDRIGAVLTDIMMPFGDGRQLITMLYEQNPELPIIAMSGLSTAEFQRETLKRGAQAFIRKPFAAEELLRLLASLARIPGHESRLNRTGSPGIVPGDE